MSAEIYRYIIELKNPSALNVAESDLISLEGLFNTIRCEGVTYYYLKHSETLGDLAEPVKIYDDPQSGLLFFFGRSLFTHRSAKLFESPNKENGAEKLCKEITKGYFCSGPDIAAVLSEFICSDHNQLIHHSYENFKDNFEISLKKSFGPQFESNPSIRCDSIVKNILLFVDVCIKKVEQSGVVLEKSVVVLKKAKELCKNDKHDIASLCKIVTALCYCSLYFLALTDSSSNNKLKNITDKHAMSKVIRELPNLLNSIKSFLDDSSRKMDERRLMPNDKPLEIMVQQSSNVESFSKRLTELLEKVNQISLSTVSEHDKLREIEDHINLFYRIYSNHLEIFFKNDPDWQRIRNIQRQSIRLMAKTLCIAIFISSKGMLNSRARRYLDDLSSKLEEKINESEAKDYDSRI